MSSIGTGYDLSSTTYSPDGKVFQIEYACKAVDNSGCVAGSSPPLRRRPARPLTHHGCPVPLANNTSTAVGLRCTDGVVLVRLQVQAAGMQGADRHADACPAPGVFSPPAFPGRGWRSWSCPRCWWRAPTAASTASTDTREWCVRCAGRWGRGRVEVGRADTDSTHSPTPAPPPCAPGYCGPAARRAAAGQPGACGGQQLSEVRKVGCSRGGALGQPRPRCGRPS
jgi:hypothetical protein